jgi:hypothetical protein
MAEAGVGAHYATCGWLVAEMGARDTRWHSRKHTHLRGIPLNLMVAAERTSPQKTESTFLHQSDSDWGRLCFHFFFV